MENPHEKPASDVELGTLPTSDNAIFQTQSDKHDLPPYSLSEPMSMPMPRPMPMPMSNARQVSEPISEEAEEDGKPMLESKKTRSFVSKLSIKGNGAYHTKKRSPSQWLQCIGVIVIMIIIVITIICLMFTKSSGASANSSPRRPIAPIFRGGRHHSNHGYGTHGGSYGGSHGSSHGSSHGGSHHG